MTKYTRVHTSTVAGGRAKPPDQRTDKTKRRTGIAQLAKSSFAYLPCNRLNSQLTPLYMIFIKTTYHINQINQTNERINQSLSTANTIDRLAVQARGGHDAEALEAFARAVRAAARPADPDVACPSGVGAQSSWC